MRFLLPILAVLCLCSLAEAGPIRRALGLQPVAKAKTVTRSVVRGCAGGACR